jgi:glycosyltransferase involved in cell wall biosynthesis
LKKIALLLPDFYKGGMPKVASTLIGELKKVYKVSLIIFDSKGEMRYDSHQVDIIKLLPLGENKFKKTVVFFKRIKLMKKVKKKHHFYAVISFGVAANIINILTKIDENIIITEHNIKSIENRTWGFFGRIYDLLIKVFYNKSDKIISISKGMELDLINNYSVDKNKIYVINNPHDIYSIKKLSGEKIEKSLIDKLNNRFNLINVGRLSKEKGQLTLLKVVKNLMKKIPNIQLVICGEGELEEALKYEAKNMNIQDHVVFLGFQNNPYALMKRCDYFIMSSLNEGFPNVLIESLVCGTPVISVDCLSGPREILTNNEDSDYTKTIKKFKIVQNGILTKRLDTNIYCSEKLDDAEKDLSNAILFSYNLTFCEDELFNSALKYNKKTITNKYIEVIESER